MRKKKLFIFFAKYTRFLFYIIQIRTCRNYLYIKYIEQRVPIHLDLIAIEKQAQIKVFQHTVILSGY